MKSLSGARPADFRGASEALQIALIALTLELTKQTAAQLGARLPVEPPPASVCSK